MGTYVSPSVTVRGSHYTTNATDFRDWVSNIRAALSGCGLIQTSDTGQIDPVTVNNPAVNTDAGYEIWRFNDSAQGTDPVFIRLVYGKANNNGSFRLTVSVGEGSNGSGTLTGTVSSALVCISWSSSQTTSTTGTILAYHGEGVAWLADAVNLASNNVGFGFAPRNNFVIARSKDASHALDGRGVFITAGGYGGTGGALNSQFVRRLAGSQFVYPATASFSMAVGGHSPDYDSSGFKVAWPHFYYDNGVKRAWATWSTRRDYLAAVPTAFSAAPYGETRDWIAWNLSPLYNLLNSDWTSEAQTWGSCVLPWEI